MFDLDKSKAAVGNLAQELCKIIPQSNNVLAECAATPAPNSAPSVVGASLVMMLVTAVLPKLY